MIERSSSSLGTSVNVGLYCFPVGLIVLIVGLIVCDRMGYCL